MENKGIVNTNQVLENAKGVNSTQRSDGSIHTTVYDKESNRRVSWDDNANGTTTDVHSTNQNNNSHISYKNGK